MLLRLARNSLLAQAHLKPRILPSAGITGLHHHVQLYLFLKALNSIYMIYTIPTEY